MRSVVFGPEHDLAEIPGCADQTTLFDFLLHLHIALKIPDKILIGAGLVDAPLIQISQIALVGIAGHFLPVEAADILTGAGLLIAFLHSGTGLTNPVLDQLLGHHVHFAAVAVHSQPQVIILGAGIIPVGTGIPEGLGLHDHRGMVNDIAVRKQGIHLAIRIQCRLLGQQVAIFIHPKYNEKNFCKG